MLKRSLAILSIVVGSIAVAARVPEGTWYYKAIFKENKIKT